MICEGCGQSFDGHKRRYCTKSCRVEVRARRQGVMPKQEYLAIVVNTAHCFDCENCGKQTHRRLGGGSTRNRFCSHDCRKAHTLVKHAALKLLKAQSKEEHRHALAIAKIQREIDKTPRLCSCGAVLLKGKRMCMACANAAKAAYAKAYRKTEAGKALRKADKTKRRAKENAVIHKVKPSDVFERDRWICQLCKGKTPKRLRGTYEHNAPELDHVISLAEGGDHTLGNLQCACRRCNIQKGSKSLGQLGLNLH